MWFKNLTQINLNFGLFCFERNTLHIPINAVGLESTSQSSRT